MAQYQTALKPVNARASARSAAVAQRLAWVVLLASALVVGSAQQATARETVPAGLNGGLTATVLSYTQSLNSVANPRVLVVVTDDSTRDGNRTAQALRQAGFEVEVVQLARAPAQLGRADVVCLGAGTESLSDAARAAGLLTITGEINYVRSGTAAVGIALVGSKAKIFVNRHRLKAEGHRLSASVLRLATLVR